MNKAVAGVSLGALAGLALVAYIRRKDEEKYPPLQVARYVDLDKYAGDWYEIARMPAPFEKECYATKANYTVNEDGTVNVVNTCHKHSPEGYLKKATAKAFVTDPVTNAKLKVQFFWPFTGDYWILDVGEQYEYAVVGEPSRKYLWILSRTPQLDKSLLDKLLEKAGLQGFNTRKLIYTRHFGS
jgi:apolipoprotein D and lipocalin family protein